MFKKMLVSKSTAGGREKSCGTRGTVEKEAIREALVDVLALEKLKIALNGLLRKLESDWVWFRKMFGCVRPQLARYSL